MIDHVALAQSRVIAQYRNSPKFLQWIATGPTIAASRLEPVINTLIDSYDVDVVTGNLLDVIGRIVGIVRPTVRFSETNVFGYLGNPSYTGYDVAPYIGDNESNETPLSDDLYRILVKAKIAKNISDATYDSIIQLATFVLGIQVTALIDYEDFTFRLGLDQTPSLQAQYLLQNFDIIPRPHGTKMLDYFLLPKEIAAIEASSDKIYQYANFTLPGDLA